MWINQYGDPSFDIEFLIGCCGVGVLFDFSDEVPYLSLVEQIKKDKEENKGKVLLATTNDAEQENVVNALLNCGFSRYEFTNPETHNKLSLWFYHDPVKEKE